jgi:hypothetical protein
MNVNLRTLTNAYRAAIYFTDTGDTGQPESSIELSTEADNRIDKDCNDFIEAADNAGLLTPYLIQRNLDDLGHDFWLSRSGHGSGFWDRGLGELGDKLQALAESFKECAAYEGDDGLLYLA